ncbi:MAG: PhzF family phenazine biosynthesis protein [Acidimicrobiales bacterium]|nr:PhzF family phenazine biosynthesis protein [Acidimicrobiales bacterium]
MTIQIALIDAFADRVFSGNPAGVCLLTHHQEDAWMQAVAAELGASETAFLVPVAGGWHLRWFTPTAEVELCGHATLASAHYLWNRNQVDDEPLRFFTLSGELTARRTSDGWIELDFPATPPEPATPPGALLDGLGIDGVVAVYKSRNDYFVEVSDPALVRELRPDMDRLRSIPSARGVAVTSVGEGLFDFVLRFFAPNVGVDEDPVTGSVHCALGPYWAERLEKNDLLARQLSAREGTVRVGVRGDRVLLAGQAITVLEGALVGEAGDPVPRVAAPLA